MTGNRDGNRPALGGAEPWLEIYRSLLAHFGPQHWWPGETPFEVMVGAVLTQNTAWGNVEKAIANLRAVGALSCRALLAMPEAELAQQIRPAGYFNVKAKRLCALCGFLLEKGVADLPERLRERGDVHTLRKALLAVHGVGEETADSILLYALHLRAFVVDAYTRRSFSRLGLLGGDESYGEVQALFQRHMPPDTAIYNEYHALIVRHGKDICRPKPRCPLCPLNRRCPSAEL
jgi:endonuclease-3 related protein